MWAAVASALLRAKVRQAGTCSLPRGPKGRSAVAAAALPPRCWQRTARAGHTAQPRSMKAEIQKVEALEENHFVCVHWEDGSESRFPCVWLRDNCQCPDCFLDSAKARKLLFEDLDVNIVVKDVTLTDGKKISVTWPDEHTSEYEAKWLKKRCFSEEAREEMRKDLFLPAAPVSRSTGFLQHGPGGSLQRRACEGLEEAPVSFSSLSAAAGELLEGEMALRAA